MARQVENAVDAGEGDLEARALRHRLAVSATDLDARVLLARLYASHGLPDLALEHYRMAAVQFPDANVVTLGLAKTLRQMGEPDQALIIIHEFLTRHRDNWELLSLEGIIEDERGRFAAAEAAHRAALALAERHGSLHNNLGYNLLLQKKAEAAAVEFRRALELDPHSSIAHNNLGAALAMQSHSREALSEWQRSADPATAHNNLAAILIEQQHYPEARAELQTALSYRRDLPAALANLRLVSQQDGQVAWVPRVPARLTFSKRFALTLGKVFGTNPAPKTAPSSAEAAKSVSVTGQPAASVETVDDTAVSTGAKKESTK